MDSRTNQNPSVRTNHPSRSISLGFTYKPESASEDEPPQDPLVLDPRTNQTPALRTSNRRSRQVTSRDVRSRHPPKWTDPDLAEKAPKSMSFSKQLQWFLKGVANIVWTPRTKHKHTHTVPSEDEPP